jgi:HK97 family phage portal protein
MHLDIGGNAYIEKVRSAAGNVVELWLLRPDRVAVIPDAQRFVGGYLYQLGDRQYTLRADDVIHFRTRHPLDDFYGLPPLAVLAGRVDLDVFTRQFMEAFFRNAGVPAGLLNIKRTMQQQEREDVQRRFREQVGGIGGWHKVLVLDSEVVTYQSMGLPLGESGLALPELNQVNETRILGVYGVPMSLVPTMAGAQANRGQSAAESDRELFWEQTMVPIFRDLDSMLSLGLADEYPDLDRLEHDLSTVKALQEDEDKKHERYRQDFAGSIITWKEARSKMGYPEEPDEPGVVMVASMMVPTPSDTLLEPDALEPEPDPAALPQDQPAALPAGNGRTNGAAH